MRLSRRILWTALALVLATSASKQVAAEDKAVLHLHAFAINTSAGNARAGTVDITIERWTTDAEREILRDALIEKGSDALLGALQRIKPRAGFVRGGSGLGWDIQYARTHSFGDGGSRLVIATDRPMSFWELSSKPRSVEYEFTLAEIRLSKSGKGEGKLVPAAKISWNKDTRTVEIENYANEPVRLGDVEADAKAN